jgi:hypothetical protein
MPLAAISRRILGDKTLVQADSDILLIDLI